MADRSSLEATKVEAAIGNRILAEVGLAAGVRASLGHVSMRVPGDPNLFVVKGRGYRMDVLSRMRPEDMVVCDLEGNWVDGPPYSLQCSEVKIHSCIYKNRPDVLSVVQEDWDYVVLMSVLQNGLKPMAQEGAEAGHQTTAHVSPHQDHHLGGGRPGGGPPARQRRGLPAAGSRGAGDSVHRRGGRRGAGDGAPRAPGAVNHMAMCAAGPDYPVHPAAPGRGDSPGPARGGASHQGAPGKRTGWPSPRRHLDLLPGGGHGGYVARDLGRSVEDEHVCQGCETHDLAEGAR